MKRDPGNPYLADTPAPPDTSIPWADYVDRANRYRSAEHRVAQLESALRDAWQASVLTARVFAAYVREIEALKSERDEYLRCWKEAEREVAELEKESFALRETLGEESDANSWISFKRRVAQLEAALVAFCEYQEAARHPWPALDQLVRQGRDALGPSGEQP